MSRRKSGEPVSPQKDCTACQGTGSTYDRKPNPLGGAPVVVQRPCTACGGTGKERKS